MSLFLLKMPSGPALGSDSAIVKKQDRHYFESAQALLSEIQSLKDEQQTAYEAAKQRGYAEGLAEAKQQIEAALVASAAKLSDHIATVEKQRRADIGEASLAGVQSIIGALPPEVAVEKILTRLLEKFDEDKPSAIHINPAVYPAFEGNPAFAGIELIADPALGPTDCHLYTASSKLVANLSVQLESLGERWGVAAVNNGNTLADDA